MGRYGTGHAIVPSLLCITHALLAAPQALTLLLPPERAFSQLEWISEL